ncbi:hypothetical protein R83H12_00424 [Fibrobacteria bacterium R8-3-H12]
MMGSAYKASMNVFGVKHYTDGRKDENELLARSGNWLKMASRSKSFVRNIPIASAVKTTFENYCGCLTPVEGTEEARSAFNEWAKKAGLESGQSLAELAAQLVGVMTWSDCLAVLGSDPYSPQGTVSARLKLIDPLRVETPPKYRDKNLVNGRRVVLGVALDKQDIEIGYYVRKAGTDGATDDDYEYLPRYDKNGRFFAMLVRAPGTTFPGQVRSFPLLAGSMDVIDVLDQLIDSAAKEAFTKSNLSVMIETTSPPADAAGKEFADASAKPAGAAPEINMNDLKPGQVVFLPSDTKPHVILNSGNLDIVEQIKEQIKIIAGSIGVPYSALMSDFEKMSFSSSKMMMSKMYRLVELWNYGPIMRLFSEIYKWVVYEHYLTKGILPSPEMLICNWKSPSAPDPDPVKSAKADQIRLATRTATMSDVVGGGGDDYGDHLRQLKKEMDLEKDILGAPLERSGKASAKQDDEDEGEEDDE